MAGTQEEKCCSMASVSKLYRIWVLWGKFVDGLSVFLAGIAGLAILVMMFATTADVTRRYIAGRPIKGTIEIVEMAVVLVAFLALAYAQYRKEHIRVEFVWSRMSPRMQALFDSLVWALILAVFSLMLWKSAEAALHSWQIREFRIGTVSFPLYPSKIAIVIAVSSLCLQLVKDLAISVTGIFRK